MFARNRQTLPDRSTPIGSAATGIGYEALGFLSEQKLDHTPANFALAWQVKNNRRGLAAMAVDAILMDGRPITAGDVDRILKAEADRATASTASEDAEQESLRHQARRLAELAADAVVQSRDFGSDLSSDLFHLTGGTDATRQIVEAMVQRTRGVEAQLRDASRQIEDLRQQVEASRHDAQRDALTGLLNRRGATRALATRPSGAAGAIALCDVDHFKSINDRFGHGVGDRVLRGVAASLAESLAAHVVARWGGEEFVVIVDGLGVGAARALLDRARCDLESRKFRVRGSGDEVGTVTVSIGIAELAGQDALVAIETADRMLYAAKENGRNRVVSTGDGID